MAERDSDYTLKRDPICDQLGYVSRLDQPYTQRPQRWPFVMLFVVFVFAALIRLINLFL